MCFFAVVAIVVVVALAAVVDVATGSFVVIRCDVFITLVCP
jgi:hypothetical protein